MESSLARKCALAVVLGTTGIADAAEIRKTRIDFGVAGNANVSVAAPKGDHLAYRVAVAAERLRNELAAEFYGASLPEGAQHVCVSVHLERGDEDAFVLLRPNEDRSHMVFVTVPHDEEMIWPLLKHELGHCLLTERFPSGMPVWASEGLCSRYDGPVDKETRQAALSRLREQGGLPSVPALLSANSLSSDDVASYAVAESLTEFLLAQGDMEKFLDFVEAGARDSWDAAAQQFYGSAGINNIAELQRQWKAWLESRK